MNARDAADGPLPPRALVCVMGLRGIPGVMGGVETHCQELLPRIAQQASEFEIEVIARRPYVPVRHSAYRGVAVTSLFSTKKANSEAFVSTLAGIIHARRRGASFIHIHAIGPALLAPLARLLNLRVLLTHHGTDYDRSKWGFFARSMLRLGEQLGVRYSDAVIAVAPTLTSRLKARFPAHADKIHYVPNGKPEFGPKDALAPVLQQFALEPGNYILGVGRLVAEKGFDTLIAAARASGTARKLVIVGGADHQSRYSKALLAMAGPDVIFAGVQPRDALQQLYENAALFVLPSAHEGLPISALEAGTLGCPMLLSDIAPNRDLGLAERNYFPVGNVAALAQCLTQPPEQFAVERALFDQYDWDQIAAQTLAIYRSVLRREASL